MSGTTDTSTAQTRHAFLAALEGTGGATLSTAAATVVTCQLAIPVTACYLLDLPAGSTFAAASARLQQRWVAGRAGY